MNALSKKLSCLGRSLWYADLKRLPPASEEKQRHLFARLSTTHLNLQTRNHLVEAYLPLVTRAAVYRCPSVYASLFPDLVGEIALTLVEVTRQENLFTLMRNFHAYVLGCVDHVIARTIAANKPIKISDHALRSAKRHGTEQALYQLQPQSLDAQIQWRDPDAVDDP